MMSELCLKCVLTRIATFAAQRIAVVSSFYYQNDWIKRLRVAVNLAVLRSSFARADLTLRLVSLNRSSSFESHNFGNG